MHLQTRNWKRLVFYDFNGLWYTLNVLSYGGTQLVISIGFIFTSSNPFFMPRSAIDATNFVIGVASSDVINFSMGCHWHLRISVGHIVMSYDKGFRWQMKYRSDWSNPILCCCRNANKDWNSMRRKENLSLMTGVLISINCDKVWHFSVQWKVYCYV